MKWTEGPAYSLKHQQLYFSDTIQNKIFGFEAENHFDVLNRSGELPGSPIVENDQRGEPGSNGLAFSISESKLYICQHGARRVAKADVGPNGKLQNIEEVVSTFEGKRFNSPNDIVVHPQQNNRLFFTDPPYGFFTLDTHFDGHHLDEARDLTHNGVYQIRDEGGPAELIDDSLSRPNGIAITEDGKTLYVTQSCSGNFNPDCGHARVKYEKYRVGGRNEKITKVGSFFHDFGKNALGHVDGLAIHPGTGYIVSSCPEGLCIIDFKGEKGKLLAHVKIGEPGKFSNVAFGKDEKGLSQLYVTGTGHVWRIRTHDHHH